MDYKQAVKQAIATGSIDATTYNAIVENASKRVVEVLQDAVGNGEVSLPLSPRSRY